MRYFTWASRKMKPHLIMMKLLRSGSNEDPAATRVGNTYGWPWKCSYETQRWVRVNTRSPRWNTKFYSRTSRSTWPWSKMPTASRPWLPSLASCACWVGTIRCWLMPWSASWWRCCATRNTESTTSRWPSLRSWWRWRTTSKISASNPFSIKSCPSLRSKLCTSLRRTYVSSTYWEYKFHFKK